MALKYVKRFKASLEDEEGKPLATLLWGDPVHVLEEHGSRVKVVARQRTGWLPTAVLGDDSLLEVYVIDVGQGDSVLLKTPDGNWHLIDAGVANRDQMTKKGAANFLRWKFLKDLGEPKVSLQTVVVSHPDYDHYGGLLDVLSGKLVNRPDFEVEVEAFFHSGLARFKKTPKLGVAVEGEVDPLPHGWHGVRRRGKFISELLSGKESFRNPPRELEDTFAELAELVARVPRRVRALSRRDRHLPGYAPGENDVAVHVLGPIRERLPGGEEGLRVLGAESVTRNGHSVVLRLDHGSARILLTGDLNRASQRLLLSYLAEEELAADVAKGCHHGSEDFDLAFVRAMKARATVISSGDNEDYSHPRPVLIGASARYGREARDEHGNVVPPLVYSTELARAVKLAYADALRVRRSGDGWESVKAQDAKARVKGERPEYRRMLWTPVATDLVYGLVNVRTDGVHVLCATLEEKGDDFDVKVFQAGVDV